MRQEYSRKIRRTQVRTTKKTVTHYKPKLHGKHVCGMCGEVLHGTVRGGPAEIRKHSKTEKRPERPYGGVLCSKCSRRIISLRAKLKYGVIKPEEIPLSLKNYVS